MTWMYIAAWTVQVLVTIGGPVVVAAWFARKQRVKVTPFLFGAAVFLVFQMMTRVPLIQVVQSLLSPQLTDSVAFSVVYMAGLALTAGLFESVGRWVGYRILFRKNTERSWKNGVAYGVGHAAMESAGLFGLNQAISLVLVVVVLTIGTERLGTVLPAPLMAQLGSAPEQITSLPWYLPLWGAVERVLTMAIHVALSLIVLQVFVRGKAYWLWVAVGLHALLDFTAPAMLHLLHWPVWVTEGYVALWAGAAIWLALRLRPGADSPTDGDPSEGGAEVRPSRSAHLMSR